MISPDYVRTMAAYNAWQNDGLYAAADGLTEAERRTDRAAFFGSIHGTLSHILWGDRIWMHRFAATPKPNISNIARSVDEEPDWTELKAARQIFDRTIADWADSLAEADLAGDMTWHSAAVDRDSLQQVERSLICILQIIEKENHRFTGACKRSNEFEHCFDKTLIGLGRREFRRARDLPNQCRQRRYDLD